MPDDRDLHDDADEPPRGTWPTYRYRLGGPDVAEQTGTIKAPSFAEAARRIVARRLSDLVGPTLVYLRLRTAGEEELLVRVTPGADRGRAPRYDVVPSHAWRFGDGSAAGDLPGGA